MTKSGSGDGGSSRDGPGGDKRPPSSKKKTAPTPPPRRRPPAPRPVWQTPAEMWRLMSGRPNQGNPRPPPVRALSLFCSPPLPPPPPAGGGIRVGGGASGSGSQSADISNTRPQKRRPSVVVAPEGFPPVCTICKRRFDTPKALFGHLRSHPDRPWRGAYPPPGFEDDYFGIARMHIDLNERPQPPQSREAMDEGEEIDLNKPPPKKDDDEGSSN